jgi:hypothetical protein
MIVCLSKNLSDQYINMFAEGSGLPLKDYSYKYNNHPVLIRSLAKRKLIKELLENKKTFFYMDSGYFGNYKSPANPLGWKYYHRIVKNGLQHSDIIDRPDDRWRKLEINIEKRKKGKHILLVAPSEKPCKYYGINLETWLEETLTEIKKHTDRPIIVRRKANRTQRLNKTIYEQFVDCHAVVTYQSIAAVESILFGVPAFTLAPTAADPVSDKNLALIDNPTVHDDQLIHKWAHHLAYGQYHIEEFKNGNAYKLLQKDGI